MQNLECSLCKTETVFYITYKQKEYYRCPHCDAIQLHPIYYLSGNEEKEFYLTHNNDVEDIRYQQFVSPIVNQVISNYDNKHKGLDFGAGTGPVITKLLNDLGFDMRLFDPFFSNEPNALKQKYDFIVSCEVVEHFHYPKLEFQLLRSLLKNKGSLMIMTELYNDDMDFKQWYYKNDPTHVFFYTENTFKYIMKTFNFNNLHINDRLIHLSL